MEENKIYPAIEIMAMNRKERRRIAKYNDKPMLPGSSKPYTK